MAKSMKRRFDRLHDAEANHGDCADDGGAGKINLQSRKFSECKDKVTAYKDGVSGDDLGIGKGCRWNDMHCGQHSRNKRLAKVETRRPMKFASSLVLRSSPAQALTETHLCLSCCTVSD